MIASRTTQAHDPKTGLQRLTDWLRHELPRNARDELLGAFMKLCLALVAAVLTSFLLLYVFGRAFLLAGDMSLIVALSTPPAILLLALVAYGFRHRREYGVIQLHGQKIYFADQKTHLGDPNDGIDLDWIFFFPGWLFFSAIDSLAASVRLSRADSEFCARVLSYLATEDRRIFVPDLEHMFSPKIVPNLKGLLALPGVMVSSRETPALLLSPELGAQVKSMM